MRVAGVSVKFGRSENKTSRRIYRGKQRGACADREREKTRGGKKTCLDARLEKAVDFRLAFSRLE